MAKKGIKVGDINFARGRIKKYIGTENDLIAGIVLGYPEEKIPPKKIILDENRVEFWREK